MHFDNFYFIPCITVVRYYPRTVNRTVRIAQSADFVSRRRTDPDVTVKSRAHNTLNMIDCNWLKIARMRDSRPDGDVKIVTGPSRYGQHCAYGIKQSFTVYRPCLIPPHSLNFFEKWKNVKCFFLLISPNLRSFDINMPFAVHWNRPGAKLKIALFVKVAYFLTHVALTLNYSLNWQATSKCHRKQKDRADFKLSKNIPTWVDW